MTATGLDVLTIGNAIVDVISTADEAFLVEHGLIKGAMQLIDEPRAEALYGAMGTGQVVSGGSAANTAVGAAALGARTAFIGKVRDDALGGLFAHDLRGVGVAFDTAPATDGPTTARCLITVTPDGERTMNTYLGACQRLGPADLDEDVIRAAAIVYLEGYLWDPPAAKDAFRKAAAIAHAAGNRVALSLSDAFCVDRYRAEFRELVRSRSVDILFANAGELKSLYETADETTALEAFRQEGILGVVTRSAEGAVVVTRDGMEIVPASPVERVVDTTGAGDLFAAGFLAGLSRGFDNSSCARLGGIAAAEVISHIGARPQADLKALAAEAGLLPAAA